MRAATLSQAVFAVSGLAMYLVFAALAG